MKVYFETGIEEPEIMGSGSHRFDIIITDNEEEAKMFFKNGGRNYLQKFTIIPSKRIIEDWDPELKKFVPQE